MSRYLTVNRIEFVVTYLCNSKCRHCQLGGEERRSSFPSHIDKDLAVEIVRKVTEEYKPKSIMTFGGEPMLYPDIVYAIHSAATNSGIPRREVITNGFWSDKKSEIQQIADSLVKSGVNDVGFSVDGFHQEFIPLDRVKEAAQALVRAGVHHIEWIPCWVISKGDNNVYNRRTKAILKELLYLPVELSEGNIVQPQGRATTNLKEFLPKKTLMPEGKCGEMPYTERLDTIKGISVEPDGRIAVCNQLYIGNASETDIIELLERYDPYKIPEVKALVENGVKGLQDWATTKGVKPTPDGYYSICDMCTSIRRLANKLPDE
jgi:MoaA/NifB/PqqE/SkfB family radical SAM enzyme